MLFERPCVLCPYVLDARLGLWVSLEHAFTCVSDIDLLLVENVLQETHFREGTVPSSLDYVFTDEENTVQDIQVDEALDKSDHVVLQYYRIR